MSDEQGGLSASRSRRSTAGNRMRELLEQERERLEAKKGNDEDEMFKEEDGDNDFEARAEEGEDIIDSDFDQSSDEGEEGDDDDLQGEREIEEEERAAKKASRVKAVPIGATRPAVATPSKSFPSKKAQDGQVASTSSSANRISFAFKSTPGDASTQRSSKRKSTMKATLTVQARLKLEEKRRLEASERAVPKRKKIRLSQADRIAEALEMEEQNRESLKKYLELEEERRERDRRRGKKAIEGPWISYRSVREDHNAQKRLIQAVQEKEKESNKETSSATNGAVIADPVIAAREATMKERKVRNEKTPFEPPKDCISDIVKGTGDNQEQSETLHEEAEQSTNFEEASNQHSRTTTATDTIMTEREEEGELRKEDSIAAPSQDASAGQEAMSSVIADKAPDVPESRDSRGETIKLEPEFEARTYLTLHQLPIDTPWNVSWSYILGSQVDWSHYPFVPSRNRPLRPRQSVCPITGLPAIYKDPRSGIAYATKEAYQTLTRVMSGHYLWSGKESPFNTAQQNYDPLDMGCWLDDVNESGACNVLDIAANKLVAPTVLYRPKGAVAPGDEQAIIAAAQALPAGTTRSGGRRAAGV